MIVDDMRRTAAVHPADGETYLTALTDSEWERLSHTEESADPFTGLWKTFFQSVSIKERANPVCQRTLLPIWYRRHMTEFTR